MAVEFQEVAVASIDRLTDDAVCVTLDIAPESMPRLAGQHLTFRTEIDGQDVRRSYSLCSPPGAPLRVGIRKLDGGLFSSWANDQLAPGDRLEVTAPSGDFVLATDPGASRHHVAIVAGSGITPVLAMVRAVMEEEPASGFTLMYGNRTGQSIMFLDDLDELKSRYPDRFELFHVLSREEQLVPALNGRIDEQKLDWLADRLDGIDVAGWFLCGPRGMVDLARTDLLSRGVEESRIHDELFYAGEVAPSTVAEDDEGGATVRFTLSGRTSTVTVAFDGAPILDHVLSVRPDGPYSCRSGACASCRAVVTKGEVEMERNWSLGEDEVARGHVLTCQSHPKSDVVELTYDV